MHSPFLFLLLMYMQLGRKILFLFWTSMMILTGTIAAVLMQSSDGSYGDIVGYIIVVLICIYAFGYASSWLYVTAH